MLKMRREWRRTSSSQAEPSPWRHCWTSWASCSNVSSASNPGTCRPANYGTQIALEKFPAKAQSGNGLSAMLPTHDARYKGSEQRYPFASNPKMGTSPATVPLSLLLLALEPRSTDNDPAPSFAVT